MINISIKKSAPPPAAEAKDESTELVEQINTKKKRGSKSASLELSNTASKNEIKEIMSNLLFWYGRPEVKTDEECAERLNEYFTRLNETGEIPTWEKLCLSLGSYRQRVNEWEHGSKGAVRQDMIKMAKAISAGLDAELATRGKIPQIVYIFRSKNFFGMTDKQEYVITPNNSIGSPTNPDDAADRYNEALPIEIDVRK